MTEWQDGDEVTTTFGSIRQGMLEAAGMERERILEVLTNWTVKGVGDYPDGYRDALAAVIRVIRGEFE